MRELLLIAASLLLSAQAEPKLSKQDAQPVSGYLVAAGVKLRVLLPHERLNHLLPDY